MTTCTHQPMATFSILSPRWHDRRVLLACSRVKDHNKIYFTGKDGESMGDKPYYLSGKVIKKFKKESNGVIDVYSVPLDELQSLEINEMCEHLF